MGIGQRFNTLTLKKYFFYMDNHKKYKDFNRLGLYRSILKNEKLSLDDKLAVRDYTHKFFKKSFDFLQLKDSQTFMTVDYLGQELAKADEHKNWEKVRRNQQRILKDKKIKHRNFGDYSIMLSFGIILFLLPINIWAQWDKMSAGTKIYYKYSCKVDSVGETTTTVYKGDSLSCIDVDTVISLSGNNRKIVVFSQIFDPYGSPQFNLPERFWHLSDYALFNEKKCSLFYFFGEAIYGIEVKKEFKEQLNKSYVVKALDDTLKNIIYPLTSDNKYSLQLTPDIDYGQSKFRVCGYTFLFQKLKLLKGQNYKKKSIVFRPSQDDYSDFYGLFSKGENIDKYIFALGHWQSQILYSPSKGIISSKADALGGIWHCVYLMDLQKIEYPLQRP
jgi:hypothetical protein